MKQILLLSASALVSLAASAKPAMIPVTLECSLQYNFSTDAPSTMTVQTVANEEGNVMPPRQLGPNGYHLAVFLRTRKFGTVVNLQASKVTANPRG